jgi:uncharacterized membrane protein
VLSLTGLLIGIVVVFFVRRVTNDVPQLLTGTVPDDAFDRRYVEHPALAYLHIVPGVIYLLGAPVQLAWRIRSRHYRLHRRLGRFLVAMGLLSGVFALAFGIPHSFGGAGQAWATVVFGTWFIACLALGLRAIRGGDPVRHRRWMIRAFAVGVAVGSIRIWLGVFQATGLLSLHDSFAPAFWLAFSLHVVAGELWLRNVQHPP